MGPSELPLIPVLLILVKRDGFGIFAHYACFVIRLPRYLCESAMLLADFQIVLSRLSITFIELLSLTVSQLTKQNEILFYSIENPFLGLVPFRGREEKRHQ